MGHICTDESFLVDAHIIENSECLICGHISNLRLGWLGEKCDICGACIDPFEIWVGDIVRERRKILKLTRSQMANETGYSSKSIKYYELSKCSPFYFNLTKKLIFDKFNNKL